jgi:hypothetical protein
MTTVTPKYDATVRLDLDGEGGNAFMILGKVSKALKRDGVDAAEVKAFYDEATAGDYDHLLVTVRKWVNVVD